MSYANQKIVRINKSKQEPFLKVGIEEWQAALRNIRTPSSFALYLYLASNAEGFRLELSKEAFHNATGYSKSTYHRAVKHLAELGYLYKDHNDQINFSPSPKRGTKRSIQDWDLDQQKKEPLLFKYDSAKSQIRNQAYPKTDTEIENRDNRDNRENREIDKPSYSVSYLKKYVSPAGQIEQGKKQGQWLHRLYPNFWEMDEQEQAKVIANQIKVNSSLAQAIVQQVLDYDEFKRVMNLFSKLSDTTNTKEYY